MSASDSLTVLKLLAKGRPPTFVAKATGLSEPFVERFATEHGWPDQVKISAAIDNLLGAERTAEIPVRAPVPSRPAPTRPASTPGVPSPAPGGTPNGTTSTQRHDPPAFTVDELARACRRSEHKRTQALGPKLTELAERITTALRAERETAEAKAKRDAERAAALAEIKRLEQALAEARAKATAAGAPGGVRGGARTCEICGHELANPQALGAHKRHKHNIRSANPKTTRSAT